MQRTSKKQKCSISGCGKDSIPGLVKGHGKCQYHWDAGVWGKEWADKCEREASNYRLKRVQTEKEK